MPTTDAGEAVLALCKELVRRPSITPEDAGCQQLLADRLNALGFACESMRFGNVDNLWALTGESGPFVVFAGHTDVVPTGPESEWDTPPFEPTVREAYLYGRGTADMKASLAAMLVAVERFMETPEHKQLKIGFLLTSDEEGPATDGTVRVMEVLKKRAHLPDFCIVGEPSSSHQLGDVIKNGRRGSLNARLRVHGHQGHIAYPHLASNPIHLALPALTQLSTEQWDQGNEYFQPTSFQISNLSAGTGASNVIPGVLVCDFNIRYSPELSETQLRQRVEHILNEHDLNYEIQWQLSGEPFLTPRGTLVSACESAISQVTGLTPQLSTGGGTSDGRFIAPYGIEVVELGPVNASIHKINERVAVEALPQLADIYYRVLLELARSANSSG